MSSHSMCSWFDKSNLGSDSASNRWKAAAVGAVRLGRSGQGSYRTIYRGKISRVLTQLQSTVYGKCSAIPIQGMDTPAIFFVHSTKVRFPCWASPMQTLVSQMSLTFDT